MVTQFVPDVDKVRERFAEVESRVAEAAGVAGRDPARVRVLVATKYVAAEHLGALHDAGIRLIGENRAQDLVAKHELYGDLFDYHFIGHLQSRKTRQVLPIVSLIHSVGSMSVVQEIEARAENATDVLLEVNIGGEESKSGVPLEAGRRLPRGGGGVPQGTLRRPHVHAAALRRPRGGAPLLRAGARLGRTAFSEVERNVYFRPAIDGYQCRLRSGRPRRGDHRSRRERAVLTRREGPDGPRRFVAQGGRLLRHRR